MRKKMRRVSRWKMMMMMMKKKLRLRGMVG
jgi:hypothetical protein